VNRLQKAAKILVVDDEPIIGLLLEQVLGQDGCDITVVGDAAGALQATEDGAEFDVALVDKNLPDRSGLEVIRDLKERQEDLEIVMITGYPSLDSAIEAMRVGAFDYLTKPFNDINDLRVKVRNACERRTLRQSRGALLHHAQRSEAASRLAGGIAHDFNNLLMIMQASAQFIEHRAAKLSADDIAGYARAILDASSSASALTRQLLAFSRRQVMAPEVIDLRDTIGRLERLLRRVAGDDVELVFEFAEKVGRIKIDRGHFEQLLVNLAINARDAMPDGGAVTIEVGDLDRDGAALVRFRIRDQGCGMAPQVLAQAFEPFFTTKSEGKGLGLGLATVQSIVEQAGGTIELTSELGVGTTAEVLLPRTTEEPADVFAPPKVSGGAGRGETILLVEDDDRVRGVAREMLERGGYAVIEARFGDEGLLAFQQHRDVVALVLTDVIMPSMGGKRLVERLRAQKPDLRALYMSGYAADLVHVSGDESTFLPKPFTEERLLAVVREALDRDRSDRSD
jgi:two-component system, cell cycle sensor histidine kinase and response regulator CckA